jgi:cell wall-associated NlpC family hydrolase
MTAFDRRIVPARPDLAAAHLRGQVEAARFVEGRPMRVVEAAAPLRRHPAFDAPLDTEALFGEAVTVYESNDEGWSWGQLAVDGYVGWFPTEALGEPGPEPEHRTGVLRSFVFPGPSIKLPPLAALSLGSRISVAQETGDFAVTDRGGYLWRGHLVPAGTVETDPVAVAERFVGVPYLWGGRTSLGLDCSGLVQVALAAAGIAAPRDSDMQEKQLGVPLSPDAPLRRGDLVFWKGHVGLMLDGDQLLHANGHHMLVVVEHLAAARDRILSKGAGPITSVKRLS